MEDDKKLCPLKLQAVTDIANHIRWAYSIALKIEDKYE